jgi:3-oxoacyl-[acyl-carrier-protein] synthase II
MISPVYVVGYGIIDALGNNPKDCFSNMINGKDFSQDLSYMIGRDEKHHKGIVVDDNILQLPEISPKLIKTFTRSQKFAFHSVNQALQMSGLPLSSNVAVIFSSTANDFEDALEYMMDMSQNKRVNPRRIVNRIPDMVSAQLCGYYGFMGTSVAMYAACATGMYTIEYAQRLCDEYDYVIAGCADANVFFEFVKHFSLMGALGNHNCPFDDHREGFMMGEGSGCLILQSEQKIKEYNSTVHATLYPAGYASDALDMTSPAPDNRGAKIAIQKAMKNADIHTRMPLVIDAVSAHATSTIVGDPLEYQAIVDYFGKIPIYAPKSKIGHTIGSAGVLETIYAIESMKNNTIPHCQNLKECSFDKMNCLVRESKSYGKMNIKRTLNNSFAFGGKCISQVIEVE